MKHKDCTRMTHYPATSDSVHFAVARATLAKAEIDSPNGREWTWRFEGRASRTKFAKPHEAAMDFFRHIGATELPEHYVTIRVDEASRMQSLCVIDWRHGARHPLRTLVKNKDAKALTPAAESAMRSYGIPFFNESKARAVFLKAVKSA